MSKAKKILYTLFILLISAKVDAKMIIDFTKKVENLIIVTDSTERVQGLSNASITFQDSHNNKSHFFYAHLEPQPNGAAFAGFKVKRQLDFSSNHQISITLKNLIEKSISSQLVITTKDSDIVGFTYKSDFILDESRLVKIDIPFNHFEANRRGEPYPSAPEIDLKNITSIGIRIIGRADVNLRQKGVFALQLTNININ